MLQIIGMPDAACWKGSIMSEHKNRTLINEIVDYWASRIDECDLSVDWSEAEEYCWNCGSPKELTRCHIVPHSLGGKDEPSNFVVLCRRCHEEAPNVEDPRIMWDWLVAHKSSLYKTYWVVEGLREYEFMYKRSVEDDIRFIHENSAVSDASEELFERVLEEAVRKSVRHFGQSSPNKATGAGIIRMALLRYAEENGVSLPNARKITLTPAKYLS